MRVLVVEDEVRLAATLQDLLELNGYTVDVCQLLGPRRRGGAGQRPDLHL